jgi:hypothetical protein
MWLEYKAHCSPVYSTDSDNAWCSLPLPLMPDVSNPESPSPPNQSTFVFQISFNIICLSIHWFHKESLFLTCYHQTMYTFISHTLHMPQPKSSTFISSSLQYFASSTSNKHPQMMQLSTFSSYCFSLMSKYSCVCYNKWCYKEQFLAITFSKLEENRCYKKHRGLY